jgi:RNA polymerase sigma-70 factor (ECF subfamily)
MPITTHHQPEEAVVRRNAFGVLARQQEANLLRAARRLCRGNEDQAQDLVQDALVRAYKAYSAGSYAESAATPWPWLLRILTNLFINDYNRRRKWDAGVDLDTLTSSGEAGPPETHAAPCDMPGLSLLAQTLDEELEQALARLSEPLRLCVVLVDMEGLDYAEAAKSLNVPIGTVRSRLSRARLQLQDHLQDYGRRKRLLP